MSRYPASELLHPLIAQSQYDAGFGVHWFDPEPAGRAFAAERAANDACFDWQDGALRTDVGLARIHLPERSGIGALPYAIPFWKELGEDGPDLSDLFAAIETALHVATIADLTWILPRIDAGFKPGKTTFFAAAHRPGEDRVPNPVYMLEFLGHTGNPEGPRPPSWFVSLVRENAAGCRIQAALPVILCSHQEPRPNRPTLALPR